MNNRSMRLAPYLFILPNLVVVLVFAIYPLIANFALSFSANTFGPTNFVGFDNYIAIVKDENVWISLKNTLYYTVLLVPGTTLLSLVLAMGLNRRLPFKGLLRSAYLLPRLMSWSVVGLIWRWLYSPTGGILNSLLRFVGQKNSRWILDPKLTIPCLAVVGIWAGVGYYMIIYLAGLQSIPSEFYEAAMINGANRWQIFRHITLPALRPITALVLILSMISSFRVFEQIYVMTGGGPGRASFVIVLYIFIKGFHEFSTGYAAALSILLFLIVLSLTLLQQKLFNDND